MARTISTWRRSSAASATFLVDLSHVGIVPGDGTLRFRGQRFRAAVGRSGIATQKHEGDGGTPAGYLPLRRLLYRADRVARPKTILPAEPIAPNDGWCDDAAQRDYNTLVRLPHDGSHEELWRRDGVYDLIGVLGWNDRPVERGRGSAIFFHVATIDYAPTDGCVAVALPDLLTMLSAGISGLQIG